MARDWNKWWKKNGLIIEPKPLMIHIEGVDGAGKTTVLNILMDIIKHSMMFHTSAPPKRLETDYYENVLSRFYEFSETLKQPIFIDRFHIGELVYGSHFRKHTMTPENVEKLWALDKQKPNAKLIYIFASEETILSRLTNRGDWFISNNDISPIIKSYEETLLKSSMPIFRWDTSNGIKDEDVISAVKFILDIE